jgi:GTP-binding protein HflX
VQRRALRRRERLPVVSIVGYTNAGKSTLLNRLTGSRVRAENQLFATLDPSSRRLRFPRERDIIVTDTVGFIRELPEDLLHAFRATLEELADADLLLHVVDLSNASFRDQIEEVHRTLEVLELDGKPELLVFNKSDRVDSGEARSAAEAAGGVAVSALRGHGVTELVARLRGELGRFPRVGSERSAPQAQRG